ILDLTSTGNKVQGNFIGTAADGRTALGNMTDGLQIYRAAGNLVGGTEPGTGNLISANGENGVFIFGSAAVSNLIQGNLVGTDAGGTLELGSGARGGDVGSGAGNIIGGTMSAARNVISANRGAGVFLVSGAAGNLLQGNYIGTDIMGRADLGNRSSGVQLSGVSNNVVGGPVISARNIISG